MGLPPYDFRVTDIVGQVLEFEKIPFEENDTVWGDKQFGTCGLLSTKSEAEPYKVKVYPNPSADKARSVFNNENFALDLELYDLAGKVISSGRVKANSELKVELPVNGTYILKLTGPGGEARFEKLVEY